MNIDDINIGEKYSHINGRYKSVIIIGKTKNSVQFEDLKGFRSFVTIDEFNKFFKLI